MPIHSFERHFLTHTATGASASVGVWCSGIMSVEGIYYDEFLMLPVVIQQTLPSDAFKSKTWTLIIHQQLATTTTEPRILYYRLIHN